MELSKYLNVFNLIGKEEIQIPSGKLYTLQPIDQRLGCNLIFNSRLFTQNNGVILGNFSFCSVVILDLKY